MKWRKTQGKGVVKRKPETAQTFTTRNPQSGMSNGSAVTDVYRS